MKDIDLFRDLPAHLKANRLLFTTAQPTPLSLPDLLLTPTPTSAATYATKLHAKSIPLVNPQRLSARTTKAQAAAARRKQDSIRAGTLGLSSRKEANRKSVWVPRKEECSFAMFAGLRTVWEEYIRQLIGLGVEHAVLKLAPGGKWAGNPEALQGKIAKAEFTGCFLSVKVSSNKDLVGVKGIVLHETENTFKLITPADKLKIVPKRNTVFTFQIPLSSTTTVQDATTQTSSSVLPPTSERPSEPIKLEFDLFGNQFAFRSSDRAGRKFKSHPNVAIFPDWLGDM